MKILHTIQPVYDENSKVLILGTVPSPKSREAGFFYGHPQNRFWNVMALVAAEPLPETKADKITFLLRHQIALWDVLAACDITGADDSSIRNPVANDLNRILHHAEILQIYTTGKKAFQLYQKLIFPKTNRPAICLPSTSPANCSFSLEKLVKEYSVIRNYIAK